MTVVVAPTPPANTAPVVAAGPDLNVTLPALATLAGSASDDGLPSGTLTSTWTKQSGPGTVTFGSASTPATTAVFSVAGTYVLRLTASDGSLSAFDGTTVVVVAPTPPTNTAPSVAAGPDLNVTLPALATLAGSASDDGLPSGTLTSTWTKQSGPGTVTFGSASTPATTAAFSVAGTYVLRLTASDGSLTSTSSMTISVNPVVPNITPVVSTGSNERFAVGKSDNSGSCGAGGALSTILLLAGLGLLRRRR